MLAPGVNGRLGCAQSRLDPDTLVLAQFDLGLYVLLDSSDFPVLCHLEESDVVA